ncbi:hypothetical protein G9A89_008187 [Geosiphon pyriformis]|nr:hypothetical protein G9A89_008187 [Geosiphon pyriformis]
MGDYSYLPQQLEEHFEINPVRQFQEFWNWFLNEHSAETYTAYTTYCFDQAYFEDNFEEKNNNINQLLYSTTFEQQPPDSKYLNHQIHIWIAVHQATKTLFKTEEESYPFQVNQNTPHKQLHLNQWLMTLYQVQNPNINTKWCMELERRTQGPGEVVTEYAKAIRKLIKHVDSGRNWTEEQKIHSFIKGLRTDLSYALWPLLALKDNPTMDMAIELAQRIEDNQRMYLGSTLPVFAPAPAMAPAPQMAAASFVAQTQDSNEQLIDRLTANLAWLLEGKFMMYSHFSTKFFNQCTEKSSSSIR